MASRKRKSSSSLSPSPASSSRHREDRISGLNDEILGHVLSFLPTKEAGRAAVLGRRWRDVFASVHTISFEEQKGERQADWLTSFSFYCDAEEMKSCSGELLGNVNAALLSRRRCAGFHVPLRSFRFAFDACTSWDKVAVDHWLSYVLCHGGGGGRRRTSTNQELHLDLRFCIRPICPYEYSGRRVKHEGSGSDDDVINPDEQVRRRHVPWAYVLPSRLFSCTALRTLCVSYCRMKLPSAIIDLPLLEKLRLTGVRDSGRSIQRLISSCPRLTDLALEALGKLTRVSVLEVHLRSFALRCCHSVKTVTIDASELRSLDYTGNVVPAEPFLTLRGATAIPCCTIGLCKAAPPILMAELAKCREFLEKISGAKHLRLHQGSLVSRLFSAESSMFASLTRLVLQGDIHSVDTVRRILKRTPNLEVLSLCLRRPRRHEEEGGDGDEDGLPFRNASSFSIPCLRRRVKEMILEGYTGGDWMQRVLLRFLLRNALVLERLYVAFSMPYQEEEEEEEEGDCHDPRSRTSGTSRDEWKREIKRWTVAGSKKIFR